jgi:peptidoglycan/xylan/chitin deacetylase (PgdA/CDA1 family)
MKIGARRKSLTRRTLDLMFRTGFFDALHALRPQRLTVLNYHRVNDPDQPGFDTFKPNVSATPEGFAAQLDYLQQRFHIVSIGEIVAWLRGGEELPRHAALITFDDGYCDNLVHAAPSLEERSLPALIFLATNHIGRSEPFYWDLAAYCFHHSQRDNVELPLVGHRSWDSTAGREAVMRGWIEQLKKIPNAELSRHVEKLPDLLDVSVANDAFAGLTLSWEQVRNLVAQGIAMGSHTMSHPILTRISPDQAHEELAGSKARIEEETGHRVEGVAYPNGGAADFNPAIMALARKVGYTAAFTLLPGARSYREVRKSPLEIRRIYVSREDDAARFAAKVSGFRIP